MLRCVQKSIFYHEGIQQRSIGNIVDVVQLFETNCRNKKLPNLYWGTILSGGINDWCHIECMGDSIGTPRTINHLIVKEPRYDMGHVEATRWYGLYYFVLVCYGTKKTFRRLANRDVAENEGQKWYWTRMRPVEKLWDQRVNMDNVKEYFGMATVVQRQILDTTLSCKALLIFWEDVFGEGGRVQQLALLHLICNDNSNDLINFIKHMYRRAVAKLVSQKW